MAKKRDAHSKDEDDVDVDDTAFRDIEKSNSTTMDEEKISIQNNVKSSSSCTNNKKKKKSITALLSSYYSYMVRRLVQDVVQNLRVPCRRDVYLIQGLDKILLSPIPPPPASEVIRIAGYHPPRYIWYMISGAWCDIIQISTCFVLHRFIIENGTACWALGFILSIPIRHISHRYLVFGDYVGGYRNSLVRMYIGYSVIIILSTIFNAVMSRLVVSLDIKFLWILTLLWSGIANYFILKYFWSSTSGGGGVGGSTTTKI